MEGANLLRAREEVDSIFFRSFILEIYCPKSLLYSVSLKKREGERETKKKHLRIGRWWLRTKEVEKNVARQTLDRKGMKGQRREDSFHFFFFFFK